MALIPLRTACEAINVPYRSVYYHAQKGRIPTQRIGEYLCIEPEVLSAVLRALKYQKRKQQREETPE